MIGVATSLFKKQDANAKNEEKVDNFKLNKEQDDILQNISQTIKCNVDKRPVSLLYLRLHKTR